MDGAIDIELPEREPRIVQAEQLNDAAMHLVEKEPLGLHAALAMLRRALNLNPLQSDTWSNLGLVLWRVGRTLEAGDALEKAVAMDPDRAVYHGNYGVFLSAVDRHEEALWHLNRAYELDPSNLSPKWDTSLLHLRRGNWKEGLKLYDIRREHRGAKLYPPLPMALWRGEDLADKTLYIQGEQGIGDRFLFSRYLAWIKETWPTSRVVICISDPMVNLFWEFRHIVEFLPQGVPFPTDIDYGVFLCTLPEIHGSTLETIPPDPGLLLKRVQIARENTKCNLPLPAIPSLKVGLCWTGNPEQVRNVDRTIPLELLLPLTEHPRIVFYSFQCSPGNQDLKRLHAGDLICDLSGDIEKEGWVGTGIALLDMDLLVTVCTSVPHLAGTLGVPTWVMLCADPYWIWNRTGDSTPWYPNMRLFRQKTLGDWSNVIDEVRVALSDFAAKVFPNDEAALTESKQSASEQPIWPVSSSALVYPGS
jgi:hypothetical protein